MVIVITQPMLIVHRFGPSLCCCINIHIQRDVQALARRYGGRLASCFNGSTSHVIVSADENGLCSRTVKYLQGLATGRWIVSHQCKLNFQGEICEPLAMMIRDIHIVAARSA